MTAGSCATGACEPGQGRKAAALSRSSRVPQTAWPSLPGAGAGAPVRDCGLRSGDLGPRAVRVLTSRVVPGGLPVSLPPLPAPEVLRDQGSGPCGPGPADGRAHRQGRPRLPAARPQGQRQDLHRPGAGQGAQLHRPRRRRRALLRLRVLPVDPGGPLVRPPGARRRLQQQGRRHAGPPRTGQPDLAGPGQGVPARRGPHAHCGRRERAAQ